MGFLTAAIYLSLLTNARTRYRFASERALSGTRWLTVFHDTNGTRNGTSPSV